MTLVSIELRRPDAEPASGTVEWTPTRRHDADGHVVLPVPVTVELVDGVGTFEADPTTTAWVWRVVERVAGGGVRYVQVPDTVEADYVDLVDVDPATLDPVPEAQPAWSALEARVAALEVGALVLSLDVGEPAPAGVVAGTVLVRPEVEVVPLAPVTETAVGVAGSGSDVVLPVPDGTVTDDLLVAVVTCQDSGVGVTPPAGWRTLQAPTSGDFRSTAIMSLSVTGTPPAGSFTFTTGAGRHVASIVRVTGADLVEPVGVAGTPGTRVGQTVTVPGLPGSAGMLVLSVTNINIGATGTDPLPVTLDQGLVKFFEETTSTDTQVSRTTLTVAWAMPEGDFPSSTATAASAVNAMDSQVLAIRAAA